MYGHTPQSVKGWRNFMKYKVKLKNRRRLRCLGSRPAWLLVTRTYRRGSFENIKDAIKTYVETVEELSKDKVSRYVEVE